MSATAADRATPSEASRRGPAEHHLRCVSTVEIEAPVAARLVDHLPEAAGALAWVRRGEGLVGWGEVLRVDVGGASRFSDAHTAWRTALLGVRVEDAVRLPGTGPVAFASLSFSDASPAGGVLVVPAVVLGHRDGRWWLTTARCADEPEEGASPGSATARSAAPTSAAPTAPAAPAAPAGPGPVVFDEGALSAEHYVKAVEAAVERIRAGEVEKVVLARDLCARAQEPIDARWLLDRLATAYPSCWSFAVDGLVGATPELLVRRERGLVHSRVLAGTIRRTGSQDADAALAGTLARSGKDLEEHEYAVRSVVHALAPHCTTTTASESPFVLHLPNVMHLATDVTGVLAPAGPGEDPSVLQLAAALHPTAAVCGTPTAAASAVVEELEAMDRDRYAGPVGWVDARGDGEMGLALRCARLDPADPRRARLFAGCGIVAGSSGAAELAESEAKLLPVHQALSSG